MCDCCYYGIFVFFTPRSHSVVLGLPTGVSVSFLPAPSAGEDAGKTVGGNVDGDHEEDDDDDCNQLMATLLLLLLVMMTMTVIPIGMLIVSVSLFVCLRCSSVLYLFRRPSPPCPSLFFSLCLGFSSKSSHFFVHRAYVISRLLALIGDGRNSSSSMLAVGGKAKVIRQRQ